MRFLHTLSLPVPNDQREKSFVPESFSEGQLRSRNFKGAKSESDQRSMMNTRLDQEMGRLQRYLQQLLPAAKNLLLW
jgi:hypothetical protein